MEKEKKNNKVNNNLNSASSTLIISISCVMIILMLCYFGINLKGTRAEDDVNSNLYTCSSGSKKWDGSTYVCCPSGWTIDTVNGSKMCVSSAYSSGAYTYSSSTNKCSLTVTEDNDDISSYTSQGWSCSAVANGAGKYTKTCSQTCVQSPTAATYNDPTATTSTKVTATFMNGTSEAGADQCFISTGNLSCGVTSPAVAPTKSGYVFKGWGSSGCTSGYGVSATINITKDTTYYACWVAEESPTVSSISIASKPDKTTYAVGEKLNLTGLEIKISYSDGKSDTVSGTNEIFKDSFTPGTNSALTKSNTQVTVKYSGFTTSFPITVTNVSSIEIASNPDKTTYNSGDKINLTGLKIKINYSDGTSDTVSGTDERFKDSFTPGTNSALTCSYTKITVTYEESTTSFPITVNCSTSSDNDDSNGGSTGGTNTGGTTNNDNGSVIDSGSKKVDKDTNKDVVIDSSNVNDNPKTGTFAIIVVWIIALATICYSVWYFRSLNKES